MLAHKGLDHAQINSQVNCLIAQYNEAKNKRPIKTFTIKSNKKDPSKKIMLNDFDDLCCLKDAGPAIYVIEQTKGCPDKAHKDFQKFKGIKKKEIKVSQKNECPSSIMYVGSSVKGIKNRIKQHINSEPEGTYALKLKNWFEGECKIHIFVYEDITKEVLQIIEDALASTLKPAFGKRGSNGK